jgi:acyl-coenzyme A synthetase/AMP-(fatty) acid ligase
MVRTRSRDRAQRVADVAGRLAASAVTCPVVARVGTAVRQGPGRPAIASATDTLSYGELWERVLAWRDVFTSLDCRPHTVVALVCPGSPSLVCAFLGARAAGKVPLLIDRLLPAERRQAMIRAARPVAVVDPSAGPSAQPAGPGPVGGPPLVLPETAGYIAFSSGSQGEPKGIVGNANGLDRFLAWEAALLDHVATGRVSMLASPSFDVVLREMLLPLVTGGTLCVAGAGVRINPGAVVDWLDAQDVTVVHAVPSLSTRWVRATEGRLRRVRWTLFAGEPLYAGHVARWRGAAPNTRVVNLYGPSETTLAKFWHLVADPAPPGLQPVGRPMPGARLATGPVNTDDPAGAFRIVIETPDGSMGYLPGSPAGAAAADLIRRDGLTTFVTQDRGVLDADGLLYVEGRLDGMVKRHGVMVDLARITSDALDDPDVKQACCVQVDVQACGDVVLTVEGTEALSMSRLTGHLRRRLGPAMPNLVMRLDSLPLLPNGKVDRRGVRTAVESRLQEPERPASA